MEQRSLTTCHIACKWIIGATGSGISGIWLLCCIFTHMVSNTGFIHLRSNHSIQLHHLCFLFHSGQRAIIYSESNGYLYFWEMYPIDETIQMIM